MISDLALALEIARCGVVLGLLVVLAILLGLFRGPPGDA